MLHLKPCLSFGLVLALISQAPSQGLNNILTFGGDLNISNDPGIASNHSAAAGPGVLLVGWADSLGGIRCARSTDGGVTWTSIPIPGSAGHFDPEVSVSENGSGALIFTRLGTGVSSLIGLFRSVDGGQTWTNLPPLPQGPATSVSNPVAAVDQGMTYVAYAALGPGLTGAEVFLNISPDNGISWQPVPINVSQTPTIATNNHSLIVKAGVGIVVFREGNGLKQQLINQSGAPTQAVQTIAVYNNPAIAIGTFVGISEDGLTAAVMFNDLRPPFSQSNVFLLYGTNYGVNYMPEMNLTLNNTVSRPGGVAFYGSKLYSCFEDVSNSVAECFIQCHDYRNGTTGPTTQVTGTPGVSSGTPRLARNNSNAVIAHIETSSGPTGTTNDVRATAAQLCGTLSTMGTRCAGSQPGPIWSSSGNLCGNYQVAVTWLPNTAGFLGISNAFAAVPAFLGPCPIYIDLNNPIVLPVQTDGNGNFSVTVPGQSSIPEFVAQLLFGDPLGPNGFVTSNALCFEIPN